MKALVLSSGGLDSSTCIGLAVKELGKENVSTVSVFYGQRHWKEIECANKIADYYGVENYKLDLSEVFSSSDCSLLSGSGNEIPRSSYEQQIKEYGRVSTYVPFRNGLMLSAVASFAMSVFKDEEVRIYIGAHSDDAAGNAYADCSDDFINAMNDAIEIGTYGQVCIVAPFSDKTKSDVVSIGASIGVPFELTWSCYSGEDIACGTCGTCIDRLNAFAVNGIDDPIEYR